VGNHCAREDSEADSGSASKEEHRDDAKRACQRDEHDCTLALAKLDLS
jgi:hypothetical protein